VNASAGPEKQDGNRRKTGAKTGEFPVTSLFFWLRNLMQCVENVECLSQQARWNRLYF
jgi:hypothetical protein